MVNTSANPGQRQSTTECLVVTQKKTRLQKPLSEFCEHVAVSRSRLNPHRGQQHKIEDTFFKTENDVTLEKLTRSLDDDNHVFLL